MGYNRAKRSLICKCRKHLAKWLPRGIRTNTEKLMLTIARQCVARGWSPECTWLQEDFCKRLFHNAPQDASAILDEVSSQPQCAIVRPECSRGPGHIRDRAADIYISEHREELRKPVHGQTGKAKWKLAKSLGWTRFTQLSGDLQNEYLEKYRATRLLSDQRVRGKDGRWARVLSSTDPLPEMLDTAEEVVGIVGLEAAADIVFAPNTPQSGPTRRHKARLLKIGQAFLDKNSEALKSSHTSSAEAAQSTSVQDLNVRVMSKAGLSRRHSGKLLESHISPYHWKNGYTVRSEFGRRCRCSNEWLKDQIAPHLEVSAKFSKQTKSRFKELKAPVAAVFRSTPSLQQTYAYRTVARRLKLRRGLLGIIRGTRKRDSCPVESTWDTVVSKKMVHEINDLRLALSQRAGNNYWDLWDRYCDEKGYSTASHEIIAANVGYCQSMLKYIESHGTATADETFGITAAEACQRMQKLCTTMQQFQTHFAARDYMHAMLIKDLDSPQPKTRYTWEDFAKNDSLPLGPDKVNVWYAQECLGYSCWIMKTWAANDPVCHWYVYISRVLEKSASYAISLKNNYIFMPP